MIEMLVDVWRQTIKGANGNSRFHPLNWFGLIATLASLVVIISCEMSQPSHYVANRGWWYLAPGVLFFFTFIGPVLRVAREERHKGVKVVVFWGLFGLGAFIATFVAVFSAFAPSPTDGSGGGANYDRLLNILPAVIAVWAAALGWYTQHQIAGKTHRTSHAFNLIMQQRTNGEYANNLRAFILLYPVGVHMPTSTAELALYKSEAIVEIPDLEAVRDDEAAEKPTRALAALKIRKIEAALGAKYLLNYFEFMARGIKGGDLDEDVLYDTIGTSVITLFRRTKALRDFYTESQPLAMQFLSTLVEDWDKRKKKDAAA